MSFASSGSRHMHVCVFFFCQVDPESTLLPVAFEGRHCWRSLRLIHQAPPDLTRSYISLKPTDWLSLLHLAAATRSLLLFLSVAATADDLTANTT